MFKIAVCDDQKVILFEIKEIIQRYLKQKKNCHMEIFLFTHPDMLLSDLDKGISYDIFLLDIIMPSMDGIELASYVRKNGSKAPIIYMTSSPDYAIRSYSVQALHYLLKPVKQDELFGALDRAVSSLAEKKSVVFPLRTKKGIEAVSTDSITYVEYQNHKIFVYLDDDKVLETVTFRTSFDALINDMLCDPDLMKISASYVVNFNYVQKVESKEIMLKTGKILPLSRKKVAEIKNRFLNFFKEE